MRTQTDKGSRAEDPECEVKRQKGTVYFRILFRRPTHMSLLGSTGHGGSPPSSGVCAFLPHQLLPVSGLFILSIYRNLSSCPSLSHPELSTVSGTSDSFE